MFSFIYCLLFLQIQASAAPSGSRGFTLKVSSCVSVLSFLSRTPTPPFVFISVHLSCAGFSRESGVWSVGPVGCRLSLCVCGGGGGPPA